MAMYLKGVAIICLAIVPVSLCYDDIDALMTKRQIREIFEVEAGSVPEHEIVEINFSGRDKRDLRSAVTRIRVQTFGEEIELWLRPTEKVLFGANTPVYWAQSDLSKPGEVTFTQLSNVMSGLGQLLEDPTHLASLVIGTDNSGRARVNGHIAKRGLSIKSLPHDVVTEYLRKRRSINDHDSSNSTFHVIYKTNEHFGKNNPIADIDQTMLNERMARSTVEIPSVLYPEILVFVEYSMYKAHGSNSIALLEYLLAFWNGVDLLYRTLDNPKVRLHISHIVIGRDAAATPYVSKSMIDENTANRHKCFDRSFPFFYAIRDTFPLTSYDIAVTLTRVKFYGALGFAYSAGACLDNSGNNMYAVAFSSDNGAFKGVQTTAHEIGHTLGMIKHDNTTINCLYEDGYLMGYSPYFTKNSSSFSPCSIQELENRINNQKLTCLYNVPQSLGNDLPKLMPGKMKNLEAQCLALDNSAMACNVNTVDVCVNFSCIDKNGKCVKTGFGALDGTRCGDGSPGPEKFCLNNRCVHLPGESSTRNPVLPSPTRYPTIPPRQGRFQIYDRF